MTGRFAPHSSHKPSRHRMNRIVIPALRPPDGKPLVHFLGRHGWRFGASIEIGADHVHPGEVQ